MKAIITILFGASILLTILSALGSWAGQDVIIWNATAICASIYLNGGAICYCIYKTNLFNNLKNK